MPPEILNPRPLQRIAPSPGADLDNRVSLVGENMGRVIALPTFQHFHSGLIERHRVRASVFMICCRHQKTLESRKAIALKRREPFNPERLSYHVMFADTALQDAGKATVRDFILGRASG